MTARWLAPLASALLFAACGDDGAGGSSPSDAGADAADSGQGADVDGADAGDGAGDAADGSSADARDASPDGGATAGTCAEPVNADAALGAWLASGTTVGAGSELDGSCAEDRGPESVIAWVAPNDGFVTATLVGRDPLLHVRTRCEDVASEVACNDDAADDSLNSQVTFVAEAGETYFFIADSFDAEEASAFELTIEIGEPPEAPLPEGLWVTRGYGLALETDATSYRLYEYTDEYCLLAEDGSIFELALFFAEIDVREGEIEVRADGAIGRMIADAVDRLPEPCASGLEPQVGDPDYAFDPARVLDIVASAFEAYYPFFELRGIDWPAAVADARAALGANGTEAELEGVLFELLTPLDDGHVSLVTPRLDFEAGPFAALARLEDEFDAQDELDDLDAFVTRELGRYFDAIEARLDGADGAMDGMRWGRIGNVGYLRTLHFDFGSDAAMATLADEALSALDGVDAMVVDMRVNFGGSDTQAVELASRFASATTPAFVKAPWLGDDAWGPETEVSTPACAAGACFDGPVILLVSDSTVSAGEIFTLAMRVLPNVELRGESTSGELSDILSRTLPNGWSLGLSHERYLSADGQLFERVGIPVDVAWDGGMFLPGEREAGEDALLDAAAAALAE